MQTFRLHSGWKRWTPIVGTVIGGLALLLWHRGAQPQAQPQTGPQAQAQPQTGPQAQAQPQAQVGPETQSEPKPQRPVQSGEPEQKSEYFRIVQIGNYHLKIADSECIWAAKATPEQKARLRADRLRAAERAPSGADGNRASPASAPGSGADNGRPFTPNLVLDVAIEGRSPEDALLLQGFKNVRGQDDRGRALTGPKRPFPVGRHPEPGAGKHATLNFMKEADARSLKTLEGEFIVTNGVVRTLEFTGEEVHSGASKHLGKIDATIDNFYLGGGHVSVSITCVAGQFEPHDPIDVYEAMERSELGRWAMQLDLVGTDGVTYRNSGSGGGSQAVRSLTVGSDGVARRDRTAAGISTVTSKYSFSFPPIPEGVRAQKLILRVVEQQGENFQVPFKFTEIPLADPL